MSQPAPPRLLPMLAGGNGVPRNPAGHQFEPKLDGSPHSSDLCQAGGSSGMGPDWEHSLGPAVTGSIHRLSAVSSLVSPSVSRRSPGPLSR